MDVNWTRGADVLPELPALLRPDVPRAQGQGARRPLREGLQRLDGRRVVRAAPNGRLIPLIIVQLWDAKLAADEVRRNAARGVTRSRFSEIPPFLGLPVDPRQGRLLGPVLRRVRGDRHRRQHAHRVVVEDAVDLGRRARRRSARTLTYMNAAMSLTDFLMSGVFERFPDLTLAYSEGQIGWIPYILERADKVWEDNRGWGGVCRQGAAPAVGVLLRARSTAASSTTRTACRSLEKCRRGQHHLRDRLPAQRQHLAAHREGRPEADGGPRPTTSVDKLVRGNAIRMLSLPFEP